MTLTSDPLALPPLPSPTGEAGRTGTVLTDPGELGDRWDWFAAHGGAGVSTLQACLGGRDVTGVPVVRIPRPVYTVVVCRSHVHGLLRAQQVASGFPINQLFGLVIVADAPGRLPRPLVALARLAAGGYSATWRVPWVEAWRLGAALALQTAPGAVPALAEARDFAPPEAKERAVQ